MKTHIREVYRACLQFDIKVASANKATRFISIICDKALSYSGKNSLDIATNSGGPCWGPYIEAEAESIAALSEFITTMEQAIESYRGGKIISDKCAENGIGG